MTTNLRHDGSQQTPSRLSTVAPSATAHPLDSLAGRLVEELAASWRRGERRPAEEFLAGHPQLREHPPAALRLVYEEICLREELGLAMPFAEVAGRFPEWEDDLHVLLECHALFEPPAELALPQAGETWGDFHLLAELGRGGVGRVFLATQRTLADRPLVLKLTPCTGREHLSLARLQHTGIVPLYFVHDDPARNLRTLGMPYFGNVTLARLLEALRPTPLAERTGEQVLRVLDQAQAGAPVALPTRGPARPALARATYAQAVTWIGLCLAKALRYAHERGLVHLDVKPSNVLLATDGQPMLLDFHLAQPPISPGGPAPEWVGGTRAYMPSEQQAAMAAVNAGRPVASIVDRRADIYALGVLLYEALGGSVPFVPGLSPPLHRLNPQVSGGLSDIVTRCLAVRAGDRYQHAEDLAADLNCHLTDQPLRGVPNRSWPERWAKWRRRKPHALQFLAAGVLVLSLALAGGLLAWDHWNDQQAHRHDEVAVARAALAKGEGLLASHRYRQAANTFQDGLDRVKEDPEQGDLARQLAGQRRRAQYLLVVRELHRQLEQIRHEYGSEELPPARLRQLDEACQKIWDKRRTLIDGAEDRLPRATQKQLRADLLDLGVMTADLNARMVPQAEVARACRRSLEVLDEAQRLCGSSVVLEQERLGLALQRGDRTLAEQARQRAAALTPRTGWEYCLLGRSLLRARDLAKAEAALQNAVDLDPQSFWAHYYQGRAAYEAGRAAEAVSAFRTCIALAPAAPCYFNRALAHARLGQTERAVADFQRALKGGFDPATVHWRLAVLHMQQGNRSKARANLEKVLQADPEHQAAQRLLAQLKR
jgi:serine/threonine protein kinase/Flp pilus assembly protein TadD